MDKVVKSDAEWRAELDDLEFKVLRKHGTERAFTHDDFPKAPGTYLCRGCGAPLFDQAPQVRFGHRMAVLLSADGSRDGRRKRRSQFLHAPHRGALQPLRRPSGVTSSPTGPSPRVCAIASTVSLCSSSRKRINPLPGTGPHRYCRYSRRADAGIRRRACSTW